MWCVMLTKNRREKKDRRAARADEKVGANIWNVRKPRSVVTVPGAVTLHPLPQPDRRASEWRLTTQLCTVDACIHSTLPPSGMVWS